MSRVSYNAETMAITVDGLQDVANALGDLKSKTPAAAKVAINATARHANRLMIAEAEARYAVNEAGKRHLKDLRQRKKATNTRLSAELFIAKMGSDLGCFEHTPTRAFTGMEVLRSAPDTVKARVLKSSPMQELKEGNGLSKGFLVRFRNNHIGMVQRKIGSQSHRTVTERGHKRWTNKVGKVEKMKTMAAPSAAGIHSNVWQYVEPDVVEYLQNRLMVQTERIIARNEAKKG